MSLWAAAMYFSPAGVREMGEVPRQKIRAPMSFSTIWMVWLRAGWVM